MEIEQNMPLVEEILGEWQTQIGKDFVGYRHHVYRVLHYCFALRPCSEEERCKLMVAGCFHDLGIWANGTFDYLEPSIDLVRRYLDRAGLAAWTAEISLMIDMHHKFTPYRDARYPLVELFRQGDTIDVALGLVCFGLPGATVRRIKANFSNAGFHRLLVKLTWQRFTTHPFSPLPVLKW